MSNDGDELMPVGKFKNEKLGDVPAWYLLWLEEQEWSSKYPGVLEYINKNRVSLEQEKVEAKRQWKKETK